VIVGKTRMVELAFGGLGTNPHWGTPRNPWDAEVHRVPGGSSCGAGVSVQEGSALIAVGTDTACSVRTPAAWTGTVGLKPTRGHWSTDGMVPLSTTLDSVGILTRTVGDAAYAFGALDPPHDPVAFLAEAERSALRGLTIGVVGSEVWNLCSTDIVEPIRKALSELEVAGARLRDVALPEFDRAFELYSSGHITTPECAAFVARELPEWTDLLHETVGGRLRNTVSLDSAEYGDALASRLALIESARAGLQQADLLVVPSVPITAPTLAEVEALEDYVRFNKLTSRGTNPINVLDLCAISIPCGLDAQGIPIGVQLVAQHGEDRHLLACALAAERALGTPVERLGRPPLCR
jgi:aspartyl-tRNA(Asn)/glutamyl-tRNA(Gln) amidotransferase subunit A